MTGSIFNRGTAKRPNWAYSIYVGRDETGKKKNIFKSGFETKRAADAACAVALAEYRSTQAKTASSDTLTLAEFMPRWFKEHAALHCEAKTVERFHQLAGYFLPALGPIKLTELRPMAIEAEMNRLHAEGGRVKKTGAPKQLSPKTVRAIAGVLSSALNAARRWELIPSNPVEVIQLPRAERKEQAALDFQETARLLERAKSSWIGPLLAVAAATGARRGELLALTWTDLDLEAGIMLVSKSLEQTKEGLRLKSTKSRKARAFALPRFAVDTLREHRARQTKGREAAGELYNQDLNLVFGNEFGEYRQPDSVSAMAARMAKSAGFPGVSLHNLRHGHGSQLLAAGVPVTEVSERLGHGSPAITLSIYSHALKSNQRNAADAWDAAAAKANGKTGATG